MKDRIPHLLSPLKLTANFIRFSLVAYFRDFIQHLTKLGEESSLLYLFMCSECDIHNIKTFKFPSPFYFSPVCPVVDGRQHSGKTA
jgi:hypothetical protein